MLGGRKMKINKKKVIGYFLGAFSMAIPMIYILIVISPFDLKKAIVAGILFQLTFFSGLTLITRDLEEENRKLKNITK